jgi:hypothetical protein
MGGAINEDGAADAGGEVINLDILNSTNLTLFQNVNSGFIFGGITHSLRVLNFTNDSAWVEARSEPQQFSFKIGESKLINVNNSILNLTLKNILGPRVYFNLAKLIIISLQNNSRNESTDIIENKTEIVNKTNEEITFADNGSILGSVIIVMVVLIIFVCAVVYLIVSYIKLKKLRKESVSEDKV